MISRRQFLSTTIAGLAAPVGGCGWLHDQRPPPVYLPDGVIDIHTHIFNASDIPVAGFLGQVFLRNPETPVDGNYTPDALVRLLVEILTFGVLDARGELAGLPSAGPLPQTSEPALNERDKRALAEGIARFEAGMEGRAALARDPEEAAEDRQLLAELARLAGLGPAAGRDGQDLGTSVAEAIFDRSATTRLAQTLRSGDLDLAQNLRWAALLTRARRDILGEFLRLYGARTAPDGTVTGVRAFSPSLVDFEFWLKEKRQSNFSPINEQMELMSRLARLETRAVMFNFAPFCPLRAISERRKGRDWHAFLRNAIRHWGFVGIKLYPPMGFKPSNNVGDGLGQRVKASGDEINRELRRLYRWCEKLGVPVKSHGNNSLAADVCTGKNAAPDLWAPVLESYPNLRVNIAHFGGFEEQTRKDFCTDTPPSYEYRASALISDRNRAYVDLGYWTEVTGQNRPGSAILDRVDKLLAGNDVLAQRILYGSDYSMIGRERGHVSYLADVEKAVARLQNASVQQVFAANSYTYLGLDDPQSGTRRRLGRFFPKDHPYFSLISRL